MNKSNGIVTMTVPLKYEINLSDELKSTFGFQNLVDWLGPGTYIGNKTVNRATMKSLYIYLNEINTTKNFLNGMPTNVIQIIPISNKSFGQVVPSILSILNSDLCQTGLSRSWK